MARDRFTLVASEVVVDEAIRGSPSQIALRSSVVASFNFRHLASVFARAKIESTLRQLGYDSPLIATPEEILGVSDD